MSGPRTRQEADRFTALASRVVAWGRSTFPVSSDHARLTHIAREVDELRFDPADPNEMADVLILLIQHAAAHGVDLLDAVETKFAELQRRTWAEPDADGVIEHRREGAAAKDYVEPIPGVRVYGYGPEGDQ